MRMTRRRATLVAAVVAAAAVAGTAPPAARAQARQAPRGNPDNAGPLPDIPDFDEGFEEGLVEHSWAEGLSIDFGLRSSAFLATDCCRLRGIGGASSLRLSTWLSPRLRWVLRFDVAGIPVRRLEAMNSGEDGEAEGEDITLNQQAAATLGVQFTSLGPVWLEAGLGFASYTLRSADQAVPETNRDGGGFAAVSSVGTNILERGRLRIAVEVTFIGSLYTRINNEQDQGFIGQFGFGLSAGFR